MWGKGSRDGGTLLLARPVSPDRDLATSAGAGPPWPPPCCSCWPRRLYHKEQAASLCEGTPPSLPHWHRSSDGLSKPQPPPPPNPAEPGMSQQLPWWLFTASLGLTSILFAADGPHLPNDSQSRGGGMSVLTQMTHVPGPLVQPTPFPQPPPLPKYPSSTQPHLSSENTAS